MARSLRRRARLGDTTVNRCADFQQCVLSVMLLFALGCSDRSGTETLGDGRSTSSQADPTDGEQAAVGAEASPSANPLRNAYFGDLHVHTRYSLDAFAFGTRVDPDAAHEFAKGNAITH